MRKQPTEITVAHLEVIIMPNGELLSGGTVVGTFGKLAPYLLEKK